MTSRAEEAEEALIEAACRTLPEYVAPEMLDQAETFVRQFYHWMAPEDLVGRGVHDLLDAAMAMWDFARVRAPGSAIVRAYNPDAETDRRRNVKTILEVVIDDMPFLVDSVGMELSRRGYGTRLSIIPIIDVIRDADGRLVEVCAPDASGKGTVREALMQFEIEREGEPERLEALTAAVQRVLRDVRAAVEDGPRMRQRMQELAAEIAAAPDPLDRAEAEEVGAFLEWVADGNFIFLGYREYELTTEEGAEVIRALEGSGLGVLTRHSTAQPQSFTALAPDVRALVTSPEPLILTKANTRSTVHRPLYLDYIGVKRFAGVQVSGERRFLGLYTAAAEQTSPRAIPVLRRKVARIMDRAGFPRAGHQERALTKTLHVYPRAELLQVSDEELFSIAMGIVALDERQRVRLFARSDPFKRFVSCLVFLPRDRYNTENCERIAAILQDAYGASEIEWAVHLSDSKLARIHYVARCHVPAVTAEADALEHAVARATRPWTGQLADALRDVHGEERAGALLRRYRNAFPITYRADWRARAAVVDIDRAESLATGTGIVINVYQSDDGDRASLRCKLLSPGRRIALSDVLPIFENMGLRVGDERPYELTPDDSDSIWLYDLGVVSEFDVDLRTGSTRSNFQDAFAGVWRGEFENDRLGRLILAAGLTGSEVSLLRALLKYLRQAGSNFSDRYLQQALTGNAVVSRLLVALFHARLDPAGADAVKAGRLGDEIERAIDAISSRDQSRILHQCLALVRAIVRTNYFQRASDGRRKPQLSLKLDPALISFLSSPRPRFETFVCSPRVEGVYLRGGRMARGGIRWSDQPEDFRADVLRLLETETIRNAAIVPVGAKGGFIVKRPPQSGGRAALLDEAAECYGLFVSALLDVTDNIVGANVVPPADVVRHDEDDTYLLVGSDEPTGSLDGVAMRLAAERRFWLADSFAACSLDRSDPRKIGIGARGTWESVVRHFRGIGRDARFEEISAVAIGDMSVPAFGVGMLLSHRIKLIGAFNDDHVFLDPSPDPDISFAQRRRLAGWPSSSWHDYDRDAISEGGGVFPRSAGEVHLSPQARAALGVDARTLTGEGLAQALLRAPVDLLWNGGSGTFVKARAESNADVGDRAHDAVRIDGAELRCVVVGEATSAGFTQRGRIEYARRGGRINTDVIDTSAGLRCSDHEVNMRILLDAPDEALAPARRDELLAEAADGLQAHILDGSYGQALALHLERRQAAGLLDLHARLISDLDGRGVLNRERAALPSEAQVRELKAANTGLSGPEVAMLFVYAKIAVTDDLLASDLPEDGYVSSDVLEALPGAVAERARAGLRRHRLRREIVASELANSMVDRQGATFVSRLAEETGADTAQIGRAYAIAAAVFDMASFWRNLRALDDRAEEDVQFAVRLQARRLVTRASRWLVQNRRGALDIPGAISDYASGAATLWEALPDLLGALDSRAWSERVEALAQGGVPPALAVRSAAMDAVFFTFDVVESVRGTDHSIERAAAIHFGLDSRLELSWLRDRVLALPRGDIWQTLARSNLRDQLYATHRALTAAVLRGAPASADPGTAIDTWFDAVGARAERYLGTLRDIRAARGNQFTTLLVAVNELARVAPRARDHGPR